jgi:dCTP deaminase
MVLAFYITNKGKDAAGGGNQIGKKLLRASKKKEKSRTGVESFRPGVLSTEQMKSLGDEGLLIGADFPKDFSDESAYDLRLGDMLYEVRGGIKGTENSQYKNVLRKFSKPGKSIQSIGVTLYKDTTYVASLREKIKIQRSYPFYGVATGKSSIGRLDVLTRLIADYSNCYDKLPNPMLDIFERAVEIDLYIEITPLTFPIKVYPGTSLNQLRLYSGQPELSRIPIEMVHYYGNEIVVDEDGARLPKITDYLSVNLQATDVGGGWHASAFCAKKSDDPKIIDLKPGVELLTPSEYWELKTTADDNTLEIVPEKFYIIRSKERFRLPSDVAVYAQAMTESFGELRIHYAGFVHPCFGHNREGGAPLIFEIRGHNVTTLLRHGEALARLEFYRMSESAENTPFYGDQELKLSKYFGEWVK